MSYHKKLEVPTKIVCDIRVRIFRECLQLVSEDFGFFSWPSFRAMWAPEEARLSVSGFHLIQGTSRAINNRMDVWERIQIDKKNEGWEENCQTRGRDGGWLSILERWVFLSHDYHSATSLSTCSERRAGVFRSLPPCPDRLLFLCNQRTGIGRSHIPRSPLSDLWPQQAELWHVTRSIALPRLP